MKISWRYHSDEADKFPRSHTFIPGQLHEGKSPREFIIHLIRFTAACAVAVNDKPVWKSADFGLNAEKVALKAIMGEPRNARVVITIDYNTQGDWIDEECRACGYMLGIHAQDCADQLAIEKGWRDIYNAA